MTKPAAFSAVYSDWKLVRTRQCVQIIFEVPLEAADAAYQVVGGMPDPGESIWFGIARLVDGEHAKPARQKQSWHDMPPMQQAGILASDPAFKRFLAERHIGAGLPVTEEEAAAFIRQHCGVSSRRQIQPDTNAGKKWAVFVSEFRAWFHEPEVIA